MSADVDPSKMYVEGASTTLLKTNNTRMPFFRHIPRQAPRQKNPVILIHTEHYTGTIWGQKPDGGSGWASDFVRAGFLVFTPTMPLNGMPGESSEAEKLSLQIGAGGDVTTLAPEFVEAVSTAPEAANKVYWPTRKFHTQWPGPGTRGDPIFEKLMRATVPVYLGRPERETQGRDALVELLGRLSERAILIGHGSGANLAWLAADAVPNRVAAIIAVEPLGPPFSNARVMNDRGESEYREDFSTPPEENIYSACLGAMPRKYGIADIPLGFNPPPQLPRGEDLLDDSFQPIPHVLAPGDSPGSWCYLQDGADYENPPRQLPNLQQIPQCVWTAPASFHTTFDWATVKFLRQAGVDCGHLEPECKVGNSNLCFLEKNSQRLSSSLISWIKTKVKSAGTEVASPQSNQDRDKPLQTRATPSQAQPSDRQPDFPRGPLTNQDTPGNHGRPFTEPQALALNAAPAPVQFHPPPAPPAQAVLHTGSTVLADDRISASHVGAQYQASSDGPFMAHSQATTQRSVSTQNVARLPAANSLISHSSQQLTVPDFQGQSLSHHLAAPGHTRPQSRALCAKKPRGKRGPYRKTRERMRLVAEREASQNSAPIAPNVADRTNSLTTSSSFSSATFLYSNANLQPAVADSTRKEYTTESHSQHIGGPYFTSEAAYAKRIQDTPRSEPDGYTASDYKASTGDVVATGTGSVRVRSDSIPGPGILDFSKS